jgi:D-alanine-D-alanine ligase
MTHVLVLAGGLSHERDVSLRSGRRVADALSRGGCETHVRDVDSTLLDTISATRPDVVWPVLHGATGEDGALRDVLQTLQIPYVGARPASCRLTWDKPVAKALVSAAGVSTPRGVALSHATFRELGAAAVLASVVGSLGLPLAVKPARGGSALGLSIVRTAEELPTAMVAAYAYGDIALLETFIAGTEVSVTVLEDERGEPRALPAVEIVPDGGVYSYDARYTAGATEFFAPARLSRETAAAAAAAALTAYRVLGHRHLSRMDLIIDAEGTPWFLEGNISPGMTETSLVPLALEAAGLDPTDVYARLVEHALIGTAAPSPAR